MARFNYRLQGVLNLRLQQEEQAKSDFSEAARELNEQLEILEELKKRKAEYVEEGYRLRGANIMDVTEIMYNDNAVDRMDVLIKDQERKLERYEAKYEMARIKLTRAMQERKMQERLREKAFEQFVEEEKEAEAKEMDERTSFSYTRKDNSGR